MKLLTLNTHSLIEPDYEAKREIFVNVIANEQPDVFALQEVNQTASAPQLENIPTGYFPCPCNQVPLKADNHAAAVYSIIGAGFRQKSVMTNTMRAWLCSAVPPSPPLKICC